MKKVTFWGTLLLLLVAVISTKAQTYSLKGLTSGQFKSGGTDQWSFERHDVNAGTYANFTMYGDTSLAVNYYDPYMIERFGLYPIMTPPSSGTKFTTARNAWFSNKSEYVYVAEEYPAGTSFNGLTYGYGDSYNYPDSLQGYEVYSLATGVNAAITFTVPAEGYYRVDMKVLREDLWNSIGQMKVYQFFRYGGTGTAYPMGKDFFYGKTKGIDCNNNETVYQEYLAKAPESPVITNTTGTIRAFRGLPTGSASSYFYFYAKAGDKISFEADARSTGNTESAVRGAYARTKWLNLAVAASDETTAKADPQFVDAYQSSEQLTDSLWSVIDTAAYIITEEGPQKGYNSVYLSQLETLWTTISQKLDDNVIRAMEIPSLIDQLWVAIKLARTPVLPTPVSGNYYVIKNYTTGTYLGGSGSGSNAVLHENAATNPYYHVFLLSGDNTAGYTLKQVASGNYVTHNNAYTGSYAVANSNNRQLFRYDNMANPNYYVIQKKKDDGTFANGIGFDNQASGSICYFDKGSDKSNTWLFDASEAKTILVEQLSVTIAEAQALYDNNKEIDGAASVLSAIATANAVKNNANASAADVIAAINSLKTAYQNLALADKLRLAIASAQALLDANPTTSGAADLQTAINAAKSTYNASKTVYNASSITQAITDLATAKAAFGSLASGYYYMLVNDQYYVTNPGNFATTTNKDYVISVALGSLSTTQNTTGNSQVLKVTKQDNGRYLFFSALYEEGISNSGPDGAHYRNINENAAFRAEYSGTGELDWRTMNILFGGAGTGYAIQDAGSSAAKGYWGYDATNQKLVNGQTSAQYLFKFIPATLSSVSSQNGSHTLVYGVDKNIRVVADEQVNISIYTLAGVLVTNKVVSGTQDIPVQNAGLYIVKVNEKAVKVIVK
jgi:hypothetical protein